MLDKSWCVKYRGNLSLGIMKVVPIDFTADLQLADDVFCRAVMHRKCAANRCVIDRALTEIEVRYWCSFLLRRIHYLILWRTIQTLVGDAQTKTCLHHHPWFSKKKKFHSLHITNIWGTSLCKYLPWYTIRLSCASAANMVKWSNVSF